MRGLIRSVRAVRTLGCKTFWQSFPTKAPASSNQHTNMANDGRGYITKYGFVHKMAWQTPEW
eukprot:1904937-Pleurochrysis_carterae.AAC.3